MLGPSPKRTLVAAGTVVQSRDYADYREVDGVKLPFAQEWREGFHFIIRLSEIKHNVPVDDAKFSKPKSSSIPEPPLSTPLPECGR